MPFLLSSHLVYSIKCVACNATYIGKTLVSLDERFGKHLKSNEHSALKDHIRKCGKSHAFNVKDVKILDRAHNDYHLEHKESVLIKHLKPSFNNNKTSQPLYLI